MLEQVSNFDQDIEFVVGFAGSGKSTELAKRATRKTLVMTPTHKAAEVLMKKGVPAYTIHSVLGLIPTINENFRKGQKIQTLRKIGGTKLDDMTDIFIDEFSMLSMDILDHLLELLPNHCKVTIFGDPFQLSPVSGEPIDPTYYTDNITELTTQHRADNPEIVETFMRFMMYIKTGDNNIDLRVNLPKGDLSTYNPDTDRALAYTNAKVLQMNDEIGMSCLGLPEEIVKGEEVLVNDMSAIFMSTNGTPKGAAFPGTMSKGKMMEGAKFDEKSYEILTNIDKFRTNLSDYDTCVVEIDDSNYTCWYDVNHYANSKALKQKVEEMQELVAMNNNIPKEMKLADWCRENRGQPYVQERGNAWSKYLAHQNIVFNIRRPFATTIHKSQGQEFETVYIAQGDIKRSIRNGYYETYSRLMYVALSRAINNVIIV